MKERLKKHYIPLISFIIIAGLIFYISKGKRDTITFIALSTGYISLLILAISLIIGPLNLLLNNKNPISTYLRRDIGILGGTLAVMHSITGLFVHLRGKMWLYFINDAKHVRLDNFGLANYTGLISALIIILLLITSNDYFLTKLNPQKWKNVQRLSYLMFILVAIHCYFYRIGKDSLSIFFWFYIPLFSIVLILQIVGVYRRIFLKAAVFFFNLM
jgi:sulfoxide reductase heme-binding subunit YedZ